MKKDCCPKCDSKKCRIKYLNGKIILIDCPCGYVYDSKRKACFVNYDD